MNLPHLAKRIFGDQMGPNVQKAMPFGSPPHQGLKNCNLSQQNYFFSTLFRGQRGIFCGFSAAGHTLQLSCFLAVPAAPGRLNPTWVTGKPLILNWAAMGLGHDGFGHGELGHDGLGVEQGVRRQLMKAALLMRMALANESGTGR